MERNTNISGAALPHSEHSVLFERTSDADCSHILLSKRSISSSDIAAHPVVLR